MFAHMPELSRLQTLPLPLSLAVESTMIKQTQFRFIRNVLVLIVASSLLSLADSSNLLDEAKGMSTWLTQVRRELHQIPELMFEEYNTSAKIRQHLDQMGIPYKHPYAETGVVGRVGSGKPIVALRADMDALPIHEPEGLEFRSLNDGVMHACGHDGESCLTSFQCQSVSLRYGSLHDSVSLTAVTKACP